MSEWIPVSKKSPDNDTRALITYEFKNDNHTVERCICCATYYEIASGWWDDNGVFIPYNDVLAWMPLPEPWEEGTQHD